MMFKKPPRKLCYIMDRVGRRANSYHSGWLSRGEFLLENLRELDRHFRWDGKGDGRSADHKIQYGGVGLDQDSDALGNQDRPRLSPFGPLRVNLFHLQKQAENFIQLAGRKGQAVCSFVGSLEFNETHRAVG